ncbi:PREDICTED: uncharacterized protein LOC107329519 [Acropora digitifera]|uniref:uncharacterized protein LOC107329519 n=1 Tax=Acropora digitifera TaxID=70779 RepID=UPI000779FDCB|nr:PREDICTED: uncharacterized protein LOC107329519 [Acropora digitifera]
MKLSSFASVATFMVAHVLSTLADARDEESLTMRNFNADFHPSDKQMLASLKKANLESHGFKKEIITLVRRDPKTNNEMFEKRYFYYQVVPCSRASEVVQKLQTLMSAVVPVKLAQKTLSEIKVRKLTTMKQCKVGVEIHFKKGNKCSGKKKARSVRRFACWWCKGVCIAVSAEK